MHHYFVAVSTTCDPYLPNIDTPMEERRNARKKMLSSLITNIRG